MSGRVCTRGDILTESSKSATIVVIYVDGAHWRYLDMEIKESSPDL